jgi:heme exporter protein CcmD
MSELHGTFIFASYAITALVLGGVIGWTLLDYRNLRRALDKLPNRDGAQRDGENAG